MTCGVLAWGPDRCTLHHRVNVLDLMAQILVFVSASGDRLYADKLRIRFESFRHEHQSFKGVHARSVATQARDCFICCKSIVIIAA